MGSDVASLRAELDAHGRRDELARLVRTIALAAADEERIRFGDGIDELLGEAELTIEDGTVGTTNVLKALGRVEPPIVQGRTLIALLLAHGIALDPPQDEEAAMQVAERLCWLAAHSWVDALWALEDDGGLIWEALAKLVHKSDETGTPNGRASALAAAAALAASGHDAAVQGRETLAMSVRDPLLQTLLGNAAAPTAPTLPMRRGATSLTGEIVAAPLGPIALVLWTATGLILVRYLFRFIANVILRTKRPTNLTVDATGVTLDAKLDILGRTIRSASTRIPKDNLARATREVRYPRLALYAGLLALAIGTYVGASLITDGTRAGSPSLLALGAAIFGVGVAIDLIFANLLLGGRGQHRLVFVPRRGRAVAIAIADPGAADEALQHLA